MIPSSGKSSEFPSSTTSPAITRVVTHSPPNAVTVHTNNCNSLSDYGSSSTTTTSNSSTNPLPNPPIIHQSMNPQHLLSSPQLQQYFPEQHINLPNKAYPSDPQQQILYLNRILSDKHNQNVKYAELFDSILTRLTNFCDTRDNKDTPLPHPLDEIKSILEKFKSLQSLPLISSSPPPSPSVSSLSSSSSTSPSALSTSSSSPLLQASSGLSSCSPNISSSPAVFSALACSSSASSASPCPSSPSMSSATPPVTISSTATATTPTTANRSPITLNRASTSSSISSSSSSSSSSSTSSIYYSNASHKRRVDVLQNASTNDKSPKRSLAQCPTSPHLLPIQIAPSALTSTSVIPIIPITTTSSTTTTATTNNTMTSNPHIMIPSSNSNWSTPSTSTTLISTPTATTPLSSTTTNATSALVKKEIEAFNEASRNADRNGQQAEEESEDDQESVIDGSYDEDEESSSSSSSSSSCNSSAQPKKAKFHVKPSRILTNVPKFPYRTIHHTVQVQYTLTNKETSRMSKIEKEALVEAPVRIMGDPFSGLYVVAKDVCILIHTRKGNVAKSIGHFSELEKAKMQVLCPRSNNTISTHVLTVLKPAGVKRLLTSSRSSLAPGVLNWMMTSLNLILEEAKKPGFKLQPQPPHHHLPQPHQQSQHLQLQHVERSPRPPKQEIQVLSPQLQQLQLQQQQQQQPQQQQQQQPSQPQHNQQPPQQQIPQFQLTQQQQQQQHQLQQQLQQQQQQQLLNEQKNNSNQPGTFTLPTTIQHILFNNSLQNFLPLQQQQQQQQQQPLQQQQQQQQLTNQQQLLNLLATQNLAAQNPLLFSPNLNYAFNLPFSFPQNNSLVTQTSPPIPQSQPTSIINQLNPTLDRRQ